MHCRLLVIAVFFIFGQSAVSQELSENKYHFGWNNGFTLQREDQKMMLKFGGRIFIDHAYFFQSESLDNNRGLLQSKSGTEIRNARMFFSGSVYGNIDFKLQVDFAGEEVTIKDAYVGIREIPALGTLMIGYFHEPFRLNSLTSGKYGTFMERAPNSDFIQSRNNGIMALNTFVDQRLAVQVAAFRNANNDSYDAFANEGYALTGRATFLPYRDLQKNRLLHLGGAFSLRKSDSRIFQLSVDPPSHLAESYLVTEEIADIRHISLFNFETAYVHGPFSFQGEYLLAELNTQNKNFNLSSFYGELGYFLTGEHKNYRSSYDGFGRITPKANFGADGGLGAWEVAVRYSETDLSPLLDWGGIQRDWVVGVNWYLNPVTRMLINFSRTEFRNLGYLNTVQGRIQIDF